MADKNLPANFSERLLFGFIAGFLATLIFHQLALMLLWGYRYCAVGSFSHGSDATVRRAGDLLVGVLGRHLGHVIRADP